MFAARHVYLSIAIASAAASPSTMAAAGALAPTPVFPSKAVRMLVGFSPGGATDVVARVIGRALAETWNQQVIIDNRAGAGGLIAFEITAKAEPDGHTLLATSPSFAIQPSVAARLPFDPMRDFEPVSQVAAAPYVLVLHPAVDARSVAELVALAKASPGRLNYASGGVGSAQHLTAELFKLTTRVDIVHVPFKGAVNTAELLAGRVQILFSGVPQALPHVQAGRLRALAVTTPARSSAMPDTPTFGEAGVPGFEVTVWYGVLATGRTPKARVDRIYSDLLDALRVADVRQQLTSLGLEPVGNSPAEFRAKIRAEIAQWARVVTQAGVRLE